MGPAGPTPEVWTYTAGPSDYSNCSGYLTSDAKTGARTHRRVACSRTSAACRASIAPDHRLSAGQRRTGSYAMRQEVRTPPGRVRRHLRPDDIQLRCHKQLANRDAVAVALRQDSGQRHVRRGRADGDLQGLRAGSRNTIMPLVNAHPVTACHAPRPVYCAGQATRPRLVPT